MDIFEVLQPAIAQIQQELQKSIQDSFPRTLKDPIRYFLETTGKKVRPLLTMYSCELVGEKAEAALPAAVAVELFHDFTLIHDDIMDQDTLRRGRPTIHVKWDEGTAILVGDALIGMAYRNLLQSRSNRLSELVAHFSEALVKVCEGQALDKEFEQRSEVTVEEYLDMISKKTAWLFRLSCQLGGIIGKAGEEQLRALVDFGYHIGMGFQIQDDLLDFVADQSKLGKAVGSDWKLDKKTYVTLKYQEKLKEDPALARRYPANVWEFASLGELKEALYELGIVEETRKMAEEYFTSALNALRQIRPLNSENVLYQIVRFLQQRQY